MKRSPSPSSPNANNTHALLPLPLLRRANPPPTFQARLARPYPQPGCCNNTNPPPLLLLLLLWQQCALPAAPSLSLCSLDLGGREGATRQRDRRCHSSAPCVATDTTTTTSSHPHALPPILFACLRFQRVQHVHGSLAVSATARREREEHVLWPCNSNAVARCMPNSRPPWNRAHAVLVCAFQCNAVIYGCQFQPCGFLSCRSPLRITLLYVVPEHRLYVLHARKSVHVSSPLPLLPLFSSSFPLVV